MKLNGKDLGKTAIELGLVVAIMDPMFNILAMMGPEEKPAKEGEEDLVVTRMAGNDKGDPTFAEYNVMSVSQDGDAFLELMRK